ncbi:MAG: electron transfer flavoprotein subunit alpha/FixB family protein, partial [Rhodothermales bacterium]|nr:electron transfer flavoprotein subunit alpha/FixB family protein [Rhodothermales bacterium]
MPAILVYLSATSGRIRRSSLEVLSRCREIADRDSYAVIAVIADPSAESLSSTAAAYGADRIYAVSDSGFGTHINEPLIDLLSKVVAQESPRLIVLAGTEGGKDVLGALSIRIGAAVLPDVARFDVRGSTVEATRPVMAAKKLANVQSDAGCVIVSVRSGSYAAVQRAADGAAAPVEFDYESVTVRQTMRELVVAESGSVDLSEASVVVS